MTVNQSVRPLMVILAMSLMTIPALARNAGEPGFVTRKVMDLSAAGTSFMQVPVFSLSRQQEQPQASEALGNFTMTGINRQVLGDLVASRPEFIEVTLPRRGTTAITLLLYRVNISGNGFTLQTNDGRSFGEYNPVVHYRGMVENDPQSVASVSFSQEETMALISTGEGNYVLGKMDLPGTNGNNYNDHRYVFYNDRDLLVPFVYDCGTNTSGLPRDPLPVPNGNTPSVQSTNCVDWFWETDYDIFVGKGSLANVNSYMQGVFNQVSTLYNNDGISITLQTLYVWTSTDPYTGPSTSNYLSQFGANRTSFTGDLANLMGYNGGGGVAYVDGLCASNQFRMGYCGIGSTFNNVPTYSWTVEVVTHEEGHLLGSYHTHDCVWNGNNTAIDGCGDQAGYNGSGNCATGPLPASGTIMSYCHLVGSVGINFNNGFGPQPTAVMLGNVNTSTCLAPCSSCQPPNQPGSISGQTSYCLPSSQTYSIVSVMGATSYSWTLPSGWTGSSTTNTITVTQGTTGGTISVTADNSCGSSPARTLTVTGNAGPGQAGNLTGSTSVCQGTVNVYKISPVSGATSYTWSLPSGWTGTSTIDSIMATAGASGGTISVYASNACGNSSTRTLTVGVTALPAQPGNISGATSTCQGSVQTYSISAVSGATSYTWTLPGGWNGNSTSTSISTTPGSSGGTISVAANNTCGSGNQRTLTVSVNAIPAQPGTISGNVTVCTGTSYVYSVQPVSGATIYNWTLPSGWTGSSTTNSITAVAGSVAGTISVSAGNTCGTSTVRTLATTLGASPAQPGTITAAGGNTKVCPGSVKTYSIAAVSGATSYNWTPPVGATVTSGQGTVSVTVTYNAGFTANGTLSVTAVNNCAASAPRTLAITRNNPSRPSVISGSNFGLCNSQPANYSVTNVSGMTYNWTTAFNTANVTNGQGTNNVTVAFNPGYLLDTLKVTASNACGVSPVRVLTLKAIPAQPAAINGTASPCSGQQNVPYATTAVSSAISYTWTVPSGAKIFDGTVLSTSNTLTTTATSVTVNFGTVAGSVKVKANNSCGSSANRSLTVSFGCREAESSPAGLTLAEVYPNPGNGQFHVRFASGSSGSGTILVRDMTGKLMHQSTNEILNGDNDLVIDALHMAPGIYLLELIGPGSGTIKTRISVME